MDKLIIRAAEPRLSLIREQSLRAGYEAIDNCHIEEIPDLCVAYHSIFGVIIDVDLVSFNFVRELRASVKDPLYPIILLSENPFDNIDEWMSAGASELVYMALPESIIDKRVGNVIRLYCMSGSLANQSYDRLTGLYNRYSFFHFAQEMIKKDPDADYSIIISDIENFKRINELFGEEKGNELLAYVGRGLSMLNSDNMLFARFNGDQFVGIMKIEDPNAEPDIDLLSKGLEIMYANAPVSRFTVKFGLYDNIDKTLPMSMICDRAMMALRSVKHQYGLTHGKYTPQMQLQYNREQRILDSMESALKNNQFLVYYQPKHDAESSAIVGVEALVRWTHPEYGFMSPGEFIPLFERNGFISQLDKYVWNRVCKDVKQWQDEGLPVVPVSVNVSRLDLIRDNFLSEVMLPLEKYKLSPSYFHMEVTESIYMEDAEILVPVVEKMRELGIKVELDDFGSGFSSLSMLSKLPLDIVKIDIGLVREINNNPTVVSSIVSLMHTLGYGVTAEGVETPAQLEALRQMECECVQGYYFSKPLTKNGMKEYFTLYPVQT